MNVAALVKYVLQHIVIISCINVTKLFSLMWLTLFWLEHCELLSRLQGRTTSRSTSTTTGQQDSKSSADRSSSREKSAVSQREKIDVNDKKYCEKTGKSSAKYRDKQSTSMSPASEEKEEVNNSW